MNAEKGRQSYDAIPIPDGLENTVASAVRRGKRKIIARRFSSGIAAMLAAALLVSNIPVLYTQASELPVLGPVVRLLHVGAGGREEGLVAGYVYVSREGINFQFQKENGTAADVPIFSAARHTAPERIVLRLHNIGSMDKMLPEVFLQQDAVADAYPVFTQDPDELAVSILLKNGYDCIIGEYGAPTMLHIEFCERELREERNIWYLRSSEMEDGKQLAELTEKLSWEGASQVRTRNGSYFLSLGQYGTRERAEKAAAGIAAKTGVRLEPMRGSMYEVPVN